LSPSASAHYHQNRRSTTIFLVQMQLSVARIDACPVLSNYRAPHGFPVDLPSRIVT
jgi:hypothetical protein